MNASLKSNNSQYLHVTMLKFPDSISAVLFKYYLAACDQLQMWKSLPEIQQHISQTGQQL